MSEAESVTKEGLQGRFKPYLAYKVSSVEWLGEIPEHWDVKRLGFTVTSCQNGVWGDEPDGLHDIACVRVADFDRVSFRVNINDPTLRSIEPRVASERSLKQGDLLLEKSGGGENQPVGVVVLYDHIIPAVCSNFVARVVLAKGFDSRFMTYLHAALYSLRINTKHIKQSTGIQNLDSASYLDEAAGLPLELCEQRAIATFLDRETARIDELVARKQLLIEFLQEQRTALITSAVTKGLDPYVPLKDSGVEWLGEIPAHWDTSFLDKLIDPLRRITYGIVQPGEPDPNGIPMVRGQNYSRGWSSMDEIFHVSHEIEAPYRRARLRPGDIVMTIVGAGTGNVAIVPDWLAGANLTQTTARIALNSRRGNNRYFAYQLQSVVGKVSVELTVKGAAQPGLNLGHIAKYRVIVPSLPEQALIADYLDRKTSGVDALIDKVRQAIYRLHELRSALISAAVTGRIDVREEVL